MFVPTNYTISTYVELDLIEPLDLSLLPNYDPSTVETRFAEAGSVDGKAYAVSKNWGTTGSAVNTAKVTDKMTSWKQFWALTMEKYSAPPLVPAYQTSGERRSGKKCGLTV